MLISPIPRSFGTFQNTMESPYIYIYTGQYGVTPLWGHPEEPTLWKWVFIKTVWSTCISLSRLQCFMYKKGVAYCILFLSIYMYNNDFVECQDIDWR